MAKNAKELGQVKARQTKLGKKSVEELIQIILRKDSVERKLSAQVVNLKTEVNNLTSRVNNFDKDQEGNIKIIKDLRYSYDNAGKELRAKIAEIETLVESRDAWSKECFEYKDKLATMQKLCWILDIAVVVLAIGVICF